MSAAALAALILAPLAHLPIAPPPAALDAVGASSGRPRECFPATKGGLRRPPNVWDRAKSPNLAKYCELVARAHAQVQLAPDVAKEAALAADKLLPGKAAPAVVLARAAASVGSWDEAAKQFARALAADPRSLESPTTLRTLARVQVKTKKIEEALGTYRALAPRIDLFGSGDERSRVLLEAALVAFAVEGEKGQAPQKRPDGGVEIPPRISEALAYLREARQKQSVLSAAVTLALALALDRAGDRTQADAMLAEAIRAGARMDGLLEPLVFDAGDKLALEAMSLESVDRPEAMKKWEAYLASPAGKGPFAAPAKGRLEALKRGGGKPKAKAP
jgi:tetratricopeptide (TPR) repeat protein